MKTLRYSTAVWVPVAKLDAVQDHTDELTYHCGGVTITDTTGQWFDPEEGEWCDEPLRVYEWWCAEQPDAERLIRALLNSGEKEVMVRATGSRWHTHPVVLLFTKEDYE